MTRDKTPHPRPEGHVLVPAAAIGGLSIVLAVGLEALHVLDRTNDHVARMLGGGNFPKHLPDWALWLATVLFAFSLALAILSIPGHWRRWVLWISAVVLVAAWAPVLSLAAHAPEISAPWIATVWSGVCALVYSANHHMACDDNP